MTSDGLRLALGTFTAVPVPAPARLDRSVARFAMIIAPLATLPIAVAAGALGAVATLLGLPLLVSAALVIAATALGSRGLHLDGLADTADGLAASYDRDRALDIMRRGNTGPIGAATLVLTLLIQVAAAAAVLGRPWGALAVGGLICLSRSSLFISCAAGVPAARSEGLGALVAGVVPRPMAAAGTVLAAVVAGYLLWLTGSPWWLGAVAVLVAAIVVLAVVARCRRRFGGITGDVLGAGIELSLAALLVVAAAR